MAAIFTIARALITAFRRRMRAVSVISLLSMIFHDGQQADFYFKIEIT